jgi:hypothetical protein
VTRSRHTSFISITAWDAATESTVHLRELRAASPTPPAKKTALCGEDSEKNRIPCSRCHLIAGFRREANIVQDDDDGLGVSCLGDNCGEWANRV